MHYRKKNKIREREQKLREETTEREQGLWIWISKYELKRIKSE